MNTRLGITGIAGILGLLGALAAPAQAADEVLCTFIVQQDASQNIEAGYYRAKQHVSASDLDALVPSDPQALEIKDEGDNQCRIRHTGHRRLVVRVDTDNMKLDAEGDAATCADLQVSVLCRRG